MQLDFEKLLKNYNEELVTKLRGFNEQEAFLQYWVPDSDKIISLFNLVDALYETKVFNFSIEILKKDKEIIDKLINEKEKIGNIKIEEKDNEYKNLSKGIKFYDSKKEMKDYPDKFPKFYKKRKLFIIRI